MYGTGCAIGYDAVFGTFTTQRDSFYFVKRNVGQTSATVRENERATLLCCGMLRIGRFYTFV